MLNINLNPNRKFNEERKQKPSEFGLFVQNIKKEKNTVVISETVKSC